MSRSSVRISSKIRSKHVWTHNEAESLLNVTLECEVNKYGRKSRLTPLVLSGVGRVDGRM